MAFVLATVEGVRFCLNREAHHFRWNYYFVRTFNDGNEFSFLPHWKDPRPVLSVSLSPALPSGALFVVDSIGSSGCRVAAFLSPFVLWSSQSIAPLWFGLLSSRFGSLPTPSGEGIAGVGSSTHTHTDCLQYTIYIPFIATTKQKRESAINERANKQTNERTNKKKGKQHHRLIVVLQRPRQTDSP